MARWLMSALRLSLVLCSASIGATACGGDLSTEFLDAPSLGRTARSIVNGNLTSDHPEVALIQAHHGTSTVVCSGTLIGSHTVLTAAHCVSEGDGISVSLGGANYPARRVIRHPNYAPATLTDDLAVITLSFVSSNIAPAALAIDAIKLDDLVTLVGFGATKEGGASVGAMRMTINRVIDLDRGRFQVGAIDGGRGTACHGDSGGAVYRQSNGERQLVGVISASVDRCGSAVWNTRVVPQLSWLAAASEGDARSSRAPLSQIEPDSDEVIGIISCSLAEATSIPIPPIPLLLLLLWLAPGGASRGRVFADSAAASTDPKLKANPSSGADLSIVAGRGRVAKALRPIDRVVGQRASGGLRKKHHHPPFLTLGQSSAFHPGQKKSTLIDGLSAHNTTAAGTYLVDQLRGE